MRKFVVPLLKSQFAVPIYWSFVSIQSYFSKSFQQTGEDFLQMVFGIIYFSAMTLIYSIPIYLVVATPLLALLERYRKLDLIGVVLVLALVSSLGFLVIRDPVVFGTTFPIGLIGGFICWNELRRKGILTSPKT